MTMRKAGRWALALGLLGGASAPALAQTFAEAPLSLFPSAAASSAAPVEAVKPDSAPFGISMGGLADVDLEAVGVLSHGAKEPWDRDLGTQVWFSLNRVTALERLRALPVGAASPTVRGMVRQLLLTAAAPLAVPGASASPGQLTAARLEALLASAWAEDAQSLAAVAPRAVWSEAVVLAAARAGWLAGDVKAACAQVDDGLQRFDAPIWGKMNAACKAVTGDADKARLNVSLLEEVGAVDDAFRPLADRIQDRGKLSLAELPAGMGIFETSALRELGGKLPEDLPLDAMPWLARLAIPAEGPVSNGHLATVEIGLRHGTIPAAEAAKVLERVKFGKADLVAAKELKADAAAPRGRALYWQILKDTNSAPARAEVIARMFAAARNDRAGAAALAVLLAKPLADLSADSAAAWLAGDAARAALWIGDWTMARRWADLAAGNAGASEDARRVAVALKPLFHLADAPAAAQDRATQAAPAMPEDLSPAVRDRLFGLCRVLSLPVADADWRAALAAPSPAEDNASPSPLLLATADNAAARGALGLTLALSAQALDTSGDKPVAAAAVERTVASLLKIGAVDWAKRVAVESLLAAGY